MARIPGSVWISGAYLYHVSATGKTYRCSGTNLGLVTQALPGSMWVDGGYLYYIDENRYKRRVPRDYRKDTTGVPGSLWVEGEYLHYLASDKDKCRVHGDHSDYTDVSFANVAHTDTWIPYLDGFPLHTDTHHGDSTFHSDFGVPPSHGDHSDYVDFVNYIDYPHADVPFENYTDTIVNPIPV